MAEDRDALLNIIALDMGRIRRMVRDELITETTGHAVLAELSIARHAVSAWAGGNEHHQPQQEQNHGYQAIR